MNARDVENQGSRFWATSVDEPKEQVFGASTIGIVDENEGGIILYLHEMRADEIIAMLRLATGEI